MNISLFLLAVPCQRSRTSWDKGSATRASTLSLVSSGLGLGAGRMNGSTDSVLVVTFCGGINPKCSVGFCIIYFLKKEKETGVEGIPL